MAWHWAGDKPLYEPVMTQWCIYAGLGGEELEYWGRNRMVNNLQMTILNAFHWIFLYDIFENVILSNLGQMSIGPVLWLGAKLTSWLVPSH